MEHVQNLSASDNCQIQKILFEKRKEMRAHVSFANVLNLYEFFYKFIYFRTEGGY